MNEPHLDHEALERFLDEDLEDSEGRALQRHLLACPACEARLVELLPRSRERQAEPPRSPAQSVTARTTAREEGESQGAGKESGLRRLICHVLDAAGPEIERQWQRLTAERLSAEELWEELRGTGTARRHALVETVPRFQSRGLFELLLDKARHAVLTEPQKAVEILHLALDLADHLDPTAYGPGSVAAAKARAWAYLGNALRVLADFRRAEHAFLAAEEQLGQSWLDPLDEALVLELKASLRRAQRRFDEALEMLTAAIALYREVNEPHLQGRALLTRGLVLQYRQDYTAACACFRNSLFLLDGTEDPRLVAVGQFNLVNCLHESGRTAEAAALVPETRQLMERSGTRSDLIRLRWLEGRMTAVMKQPDVAEKALLATREAWAEDGVPFDTALVSLDLAALYAREGRASEARRLAEESLSIFRSCELHGEAMAALSVVQQAAEMEQLSFGLVDEVSSFLRHARTNPGLRFRDDDPARPETPAAP